MEKGRRGTVGTTPGKNEFKEEEDKGREEKSGRKTKLEGRKFLFYFYLRTT
jgi:hypothetical protein